MDHDSSISFGAPGADEIEAAVMRFRLAWKQVPEPRLDPFLPNPSNPRRLLVLVELIKRDQKSRHRACCGQPLEGYLHSWPELTGSLKSQLELLRSECLWRSTYTAVPTREELESRFPEIGRLVDLRQVAAEAETLRVRESYLGKGRFFPIRRLGRGGMGIVYAVFDRQRQAVVALKELPPAQGQALACFRREFRLPPDIVHPNLVSIYDVFCESDKWFFTMELVEGVDFLSYVRNIPGVVDATDPTGGDTVSWRPWEGLDFTRLRKALRQLATGVETLHRAGRLHRDIKPSNIRVKPDGTVVLLDFGLIADLRNVGRDEPAARPDSTPAESQAIVGTTAYMSPEQAGGHALGPASDWYSVGVVLYAVLTGHPPFVGAADEVRWRKQSEDVPPLPQEGGGIPEDLRKLCLDLLQRDPSQRPSGKEVLQRLSLDPFSVTVRGPTAVPFVGRRDHLRSLDEMYRRMLGGRAVTVFIAGRSGVGKTRLIDQFLGQLGQNEQVLILRGRCYERESVPFKAMDSLLEALARHLAWMPRDACDALLPMDIAALARVFPVMKTVASVAAAIGDLVVPDLQELRRRAFQSLRELLTRLGDLRPLVLSIDDLQWGDADSAAVLSEIMRPPSPPRLMLLASYRSEHQEGNVCLSALEQHHNPQDHRELVVHPLSLDDSRQLAHALCGGAGQTDRTELIAREGQGSPYFIQELARYLATDTALSAWVATREQCGLDDVLWHRVGQLAAEPRQLLEAICVAGCPLRVRDVYAAAGVATGNQRALATLKTEHFVRTTGPDLDHDVEVFHDRIRESIVSRLEPIPLRSHHGNLARALENDPRADPEAIAFHFAEGGEPGKSGEYYRRAAEKAGHALAFDRAASLYRRAFELSAGESGRADLQEKLATALANAGRSAEAAAEFQAAAQSAPDLKRLHLEREAAYQFLISGHVDTGREVLGKVLDEVGMSLPATPNRAKLSLVWRRSSLRLRGLKFRERSEDQIPPRVLARLDVGWSASIGLALIDVIRGSDYQTRCLLDALRAGEPLRVTRALALESIFMAAQGTHTARRSEQLLAAAERAASRVNRPYTDGIVRLAQSGVAMLTGRYRLACERAQAAVEIFRGQCTGVAWELDTAETYRLWSLIWRGEVPEVNRLGPALLDEAQQRGDLFAMANLRTYTLPHLHLWQDDPERASQSVQDGLQRWSDKGFFAQHLLAMVSRAEIMLYRGDGPGAWDFLLEQWPAYQGSLLNRIQYGFIQFLYSRARSALLTARNDHRRPALLRAAARDARQLARQCRGDAAAMAAVIRAGIAKAASDPSTATAWLRSAREDFTKMEMTLHAAAAWRAEGLLIGGNEGRSIVARAETVLHSKPVQSPSRLAAALVPGFD